LILGVNGLTWLSGLRSAQLVRAVDQGTARIESMTRGEVSDDSILKAIRTQRDTLPFWKTLVMLNDFVIAPLSPTLRSFVVSVLLSALAALVGRPVMFSRALADNTWVQGLWVLGLVVPLVLMGLLRRSEVETSAVLALPAGRYPAAIVVGLRHLDAFSILGWGAMAWAAWRRGQANLLITSLACVALAGLETAICTTITLIVGAGMRLTILPE
jgi:hypothetical protein